MRPGGTSTLRIGLRHAVALLVVVLVGAAAREAAAQPKPAAAVVVAANDNLAVDRVDEEVIRRIFLGKQAELAGKKVVLVLPPRGSPEMKWLCTHVIGAPEKTYRRFLLERAFRGKIARPRLTETRDEAARLVSEVPGALAPLTATMLGAGAHPVRIR